MTTSTFTIASTPLFGPLDTKTDPKSLAQTSIANNENVRYPTIGAASQRFGQSVENNYAVNPNGPGAGPQITYASNFGVYKNHQLLIGGTGELYSYSQASDNLGTANWVDKGAMIELQATITSQVGLSSTLANNVTSANCLDAAGNELIVTIWQGPDSGLYYSAQDVKTATFLAENVQLSSEGEIQYAVLLAMPGSVELALTSSIVMFFVSGTDIQYIIFRPELPSDGFGGSPITVATNFYTPTYASNPYPFSAAIAPLNYGNDQTAGIVYVSAADTYTFISLSLTTGNIIGAAQTITMPYAVQSVAILPSGDGLNQTWGVAAVAISGNPSEAVFCDTDATLFNAPAETYLTARHSNTIEALAPFLSIGFLNSTTMLLNEGFATDYVGSLSYATFGPFTPGTWASDFVLYQPAVFGLVPISQGFLYNNNLYYLAASTNQALFSQGFSLNCAYYIVRQDGSIIQQLLYQIATPFVVPVEGYPTNNICPQPNIDQALSNSFIFGLNKIINFTSISGARLITEPTASAAQSLKLSVPLQTHVTIAEFNNNAIINCGAIFTFDGATLSESGFFESPGYLFGQLQDSTGLDVGTYTYQAIYYWADLQGNQYFSGTSVPLTVVVTDTDIAQVMLEVAALKNTRRRGLLNNVVIKIYRTTANSEGPFYPLTTIANPDTSTGGAFVTYTDSTTDAVLEVNGPYLYAPDDNSGEVPNGSPPGFLAMVATKNRVFGVSQEDPTLIWYTKPITPGVAASWSGVFTVKLESTGGLPTALGALDTTLAIFKTNRLYVLPGDGPDATGSTSNGSFTTPQLISSVAGCVTPTSVGLTDLGLFFQSARGIEMLDRTQAVQYQIGLAVNAYAAVPIYAVTSVPNQQQIRFLTNNGICLVYDYIQQLWSTYTNYGGIGAGYWLNNYVRCQADGSAYIEDMTSFTDEDLAGNQNPVSMVIETAWIKPNTIDQGFSRIRRFAVFGNFKSAHLLQVDIGINYQDYSMSITWNPVTGEYQPVPANQFGSGSPYGADSVYGGTVKPTYQLRARTPVQKCEAMRFRFTTIPNLILGTGESCDLIEFAIELMVKTGLMRLQPGQTK